MRKFKYAPYSFSKVSCFEECKKRFFFKYIKKIRITPDERFFEKGRFYHHALETYPVKQNKPFQFSYASPEKKQQYLENIKKFILDPRTQKLLTKCKISSEQEIKFAEGFELFTGSKWDSLFYGYADFLGREEDTYLIVDWKSKKHENYTTNPEQLEVYAVWLFRAKPNIKKIKLVFAYIEDVEFEEFEVTRDDFQGLLEKFINKVEAVESTTEFSKNATRECNRCEYFQHCSPFNVGSHETKVQSLQPEAPTTQIQD